jgi:hypothetical protein
MNKKTTLHRYFCIVLIAFQVACGKQTAVLPADTLIPTAVPPILIPPTAVPTSTLIPATIIPTPLPTEPVFPVITPDPIQVERWNEYEDALAKAFFKSYLQPDQVVCEWVILGRTDQEVYVWAHCADIYSAGPSQASIPAVIHLGIDGSVVSAEIPGSGTAYGPDIRRLFPADVQDRIFNHLITFQGSADRLRWRRGHPEAPPLIILNSLPTQPVIPMMTANPIQVERWMEYQTALAKSFLSYLSPEKVMCEWELLGGSGNEVYAWAICTEFSGVGSVEGLVVIYTGTDGSVQSVASRIDFPDEIRQMFPLDVQERYFNGLIHFQELVDHLRWRQILGHREEPPLIVPSATQTP